MRMKACLPQLSPRPIARPTSPTIVVDVPGVVASALSHKSAFDRLQQNAPEIIQIRQSLGQLMIVLDSVQKLHAQRDQHLFIASITKTNEILQHTKKLYESIQNHNIKRIDTFKNDTEKHAKDIAAVIKELTLAIVSWNSLHRASCALDWSPKIVVVGPPGSGKSCFTKAWVKRESDVEDLFLSPTTSLDYSTIPISSTCKLSIWDTPGDLDTISQVSRIFKSASIIILTNALNESNKSSFELYKQLKADFCPEAIVVSVGTKLDILTGVVYEGDIRKLNKQTATMNAMPYFEVSAKTGENVDFCMFKLLSKLTPPVDTSSPLAGSDESASVSGYLYKVPGCRGDKIGRWQERFFVCNVKDPGYVYYYRNSIEYNKNKFAGKIKLKNIQSVKDGAAADQLTEQKHSLVVVTPKRVWYFYARHNEEKEKWMEVMKRHIAA